MANITPSQVGMGGSRVRGSIHRPYLRSSDLEARVARDGAIFEARDLSRLNPYGKSALRSTVDSIIGVNFKLQLEPMASALGVTSDEAQEWAEMVEAEWLRYAENIEHSVDAQRKQSFTDLMRTAYSSFYVSGETLATVEWKRSRAGYGTCLYLLDPERLSEPDRGDGWLQGRRMGVERDRHGAPIAYHIREKHLSDDLAWGYGSHKWRRIARETEWGRPKVLHFFDHDRPDMTRGFSSFLNTLKTMHMHQDYTLTELESAALRATYAAVIESELDYEEAMRVIGSDKRDIIEAGNPAVALAVGYMAEAAQYYRGHDIKFGKAKIAHLLPNESLKMVQGTQSASALKDFNQVSLYSMASGLGVDYASLTKNYSETNYSGARAALFDVWRSYEVRRAAFVNGFCLPFFGAWLEEAIVLRETIPMLGALDFYTAKPALIRASFETWSKPRLDPQKEAQADKINYGLGVATLRDLCAANGADYRTVLSQRAREKRLMEELGLEPEDIDPGLRMNAGAEANAADNGKGGDGASDASMDS